MYPANDKNSIWRVAAIVLLLGAACTVLFLLTPGARGQTVTKKTVEQPAAAGHPDFRRPTEPDHKQFAAVPRDKTLKLTVSEMARVEDIPVRDASPSDERTLRKGALHVKGTGFPYQRGSNVYIAGHRLGYPGTNSFLLFYDLHKLDKRDRVILTDSNGTRYVYEVYRKLVVAPTNLNVTWPVPGKSVVTLQTCAFPDFSKRLVVQAELKSVNSGERDG